MLRSRLRFGIFMAPYHSPRESPTTCFERDRDLVQWLDELGFDEAWVGEHHSAGYEIIASPELFLADLAARTRQIRLGTGVVSLPYHSPLMVAERMNQLDHLTRGRAMLGVGPGLLPVGRDDARDRPARAAPHDGRVARRRAAAAARRGGHREDRLVRAARRQAAPGTVLAPAPRGGGRGVGHAVRPAHRRPLRHLHAVTRGDDAGGLQRPRAITGASSRRRPRSTDSTSPASAGASPAGATSPRPASRRGATCVRPADFLYYFQKVVALPGMPETGTPDECLDAMMESGVAIVGTPDDLIAQIERLEEQSGGFGAFLSISHDWANRAAERRSYELIARYVMPRFQDANAFTRRSMEWVQANRAPFLGAATQGVMEAIQKDAAERSAKAANQ